MKPVDVAVCLEHVGLLFLAFKRPGPSQAEENVEEPIEHRMVIATSAAPLSKWDQLQVSLLARIEFSESIFKRSVER